MKLFKLFFGVSLFLLLTTTGHTKMLAGVELPPVMETPVTALVLNGAGVRTKFFLDLYVSGLYLQNESQNADTIIASDSPMAIKLHIISSMITSEKMEKTTREGFKNATNSNIDPVKDEIEEFIAVFKEEIKNNDVYDMIYSPGTGVEVFKNNKLYTTIPGLPFKQALFGIWLSKKPAQKSLKKEMLGM